MISNYYFNNNCVFWAAGKPHVHTYFPGSAIFPESRFPFAIVPQPHRPPPSAWERSCFWFLRYNGDSIEWPFSTHILIIFLSIYLFSIFTYSFFLSIHISSAHTYHLFINLTINALLKGRIMIFKLFFNDTNTYIQGVLKKLCFVEDFEIYTRLRPLSVSSRCHCVYTMVKNQIFNYEYLMNTLYVYMYIMIYIWIFVYFYVKIILQCCWFVEICRLKARCVGLHTCLYVCICVTNVIYKHIVYT